MSKRKPSTRKRIAIVWSAEATAEQVVLAHIAQHRRELSLILIKGRRHLRPGEEEMLGDMFEHSLEIDPAGRALPGIIQAARELTIRL